MAQPVVVVRAGSECLAVEALEGEPDIVGDFFFGESFNVGYFLNDNVNVGGLVNSSGRWAEVGPVRFRC